MVNDTMLPEQSVQIGHLWFTPSSLVQALFMLMAKFLRFSSLIRDFVWWMNLFGLLVCAGLYHGGESANKFGVICKLTIVLSFISDALIHSPSYSADLRLWKLGEYTSQETQLPHLIDPDWIFCQLGMTTVSIGEDKTKIWATVDLSKVCLQLIESVQYLIVVTQ